MSCFVTLKAFKLFFVNETKIHRILLDRHMQLIGDELILDSAKLHLESFCPPNVVGIDRGGILINRHIQYHFCWCPVSWGRCHWHSFFFDYPGFNTKILTSWCFPYIFCGFNFNVPQVTESNFFSILDSYMKKMNHKITKSVRFCLSLGKHVWIFKANLTPPFRLPFGFLLHTRV